MTDTVQDRIVDPESTQPAQPEGACQNYTKCGNMAPVARRQVRQGRTYVEKTFPQSMCPECIDELRAGQRNQ